MAKISRALQKIFGSSGASSQFGQFGSLAAGSPTTTKDPATIQALANYLTGWYGAVMGNNSPAIEDRNALDFLITRQLAYIFQAGVPEWEVGTEYHLNSYCQKEGVLFISLTNDNTGNDPYTSPANWRALSLQSSSSRNYLRNAEWRMIDTGASAFSGIDYSDGEYGPSHWIVLNSTGDLTLEWDQKKVFVGGQPNTRSDYFVHAHHAATGPSQGGYFQMLDGDRSRDLTDKVVNFRSVTALFGAAGNELRIGIVKWTGTVDTFDRDPIDTWNNGALPTLKNAFSFLATSDPFEPGVGFNNFTEESISATIPEDASNVGVLIWTDTPFITGSNGFYVAEQSLQLGPRPTDFENCTQSRALDLVEKLEFYQDWGDPFTPNGTKSHYFAGVCTNAVIDSFQFNIALAVPMYKSPDFSYNSGTAYFYNDTYTITVLNALVAYKTFISFSGTAPGLTTGGNLTLRIVQPVLDARLGT